MSKGTESPKAIIPRNSAAFISARDSAQWRQSMLKPLKRNTMTAETRKKRAKSTSNQINQRIELVKFRGVSLGFLNDLWRKILSSNPQEQKFKDVSLYTDGETTYLWTGEHQDGNEAMALCRLTSPSDCVVTVPVKNLKFKQRSLWTCQDLEDFCLYTELLESSHLKKNKKATAKTTTYLFDIDPENPGNHKFLAANGNGIQEARTYLDLMDEHDYGEDYDGVFVVFDRNIEFGKLLTLLQNHFKDTEAIFSETYLFLDMFSSDLVNLRLAVDPESPKKYEWIRQAYREHLDERRFLHTIQEFDEKMVVVEDWERPGILSSLKSVWETYLLFTMDDGQMDIVSSDNLKNKVVWATDGDNIFKLIDNMDPSKLTAVAPLERQTIQGQIRNLSKGFGTIVNMLNERFTRHVAWEAESNVTMFEEIKTEDVYTKHCELLVLSGKFMTRRAQYGLGQSFLNSAINLYEHFDIEEYIHRQERSGEMTAKEYDQLRSFSPAFINEILMGLVSSRLALAELLMKQQQVIRAKEMVSKARNASEMLKIDLQQKNDAIVECDIVQARLCSANEEMVEAMHLYESIELKWKIDPSKAAKVNEICLELGIQCRKAKKLDASITWLEAARKGYLKMENTNDIFLSEILAAIGDTQQMQAQIAKRNQQVKLEEAVLNYESALKLVADAVGTVNSRYGKIQVYLGSCFAKLNRFDESLERFKLAIDALSDAQGTNTLEVATCYSTSGLVNRAKKDSVAEEFCFREALKRARKLEPPISFTEKYTKIVTYLVLLAETCGAQGKTKEATVLMDEALMIRLQDYNEDDPLIKNLKTKKRDILLQEYDQK